MPVKDSERFASSERDNEEEKKKSIHELFGLFESYTSRYKEIASFAANVIFVIPAIFGGLFLAISAVIMAVLSNNIGVFALSIGLILLSIYRIIKLMGLRLLVNQVLLKVELLSKSNSEKKAEYRDMGPVFFSEIAKCITYRDSLKGNGLLKGMDAPIVKSLFTVTCLSLLVTFMSVGELSQMNIELVIYLLIPASIITVAWVFQYVVEGKVDQLIEGVRRENIKHH